MGDAVDSEEVVNRFALPLEDYEVDETEEVKPFGASAEQQHEFRLAFSVVSKGKETISATQINDLFLALGYTLQDNDLQTFIDNCVTDSSGKYPCDNMLEAYDIFRRDMLDERYLGAVFAMLATKKKVASKFPIEYVRAGLSDGDKEKMKIGKAAWKNVLGMVLYNDPNAADVTDEDVLGLVDEIATTFEGTEDVNDPYVTYDDYLELFKKS